MITIDASKAVAELTASMGRLARQHVPVAAAKALTDTAIGIQGREIMEMRDVFSRPTPWTLGSTYVKPATRSKLESAVGLKDFAGKGIPATKFLRAQISGGERRIKRFEKALRSSGHIPMDFLGSGFFAVPGPGAEYDPYGNIKPSQIVQILSYFRAFPEAGYRSNMTDKRRRQLAKGTKSRRGFEYFIGKAGGRGVLAVWQRMRFVGGSAVRPVLFLVRGARYEKRFDFEYVAKIGAERLFFHHFKFALAAAMGTTA